MAMHTLKVTQVFTATRNITIFVEADDLESAVELVRSGDHDVPPFDHPDWVTRWDIQNEEVDGA